MRMTRVHERDANESECPEGKNELDRDPHSILEVFGVH